MSIQLMNQLYTTSMDSTLLSVEILSQLIIESPYTTTRRAKEFADLLSKLNKNLKVAIYTRNLCHHDGVLILESLEVIVQLKLV